MLPHNLSNLLHSVGEYVTPLRSESAFKERGLLTVEEFIEAGNQLVYKCPTWSWSAGEEEGRRSFLPKDKQFLITKNVPCMKRVKDLANIGEISETNDNGWLISDGSTVKKDEDLLVEDMEEMVICGVKVETNHAVKSIGETKREEEEEEEIEDMLTYEGVVEEDTATLRPSTLLTSKVSEEDNVVRTRTYDISITYDKYYQTPRIWLRGYNEKKGMLTPAEIFEDVMTDYAQKTVTVDPHPHLPSSGPMGSIHPCMHGPTMKRIIDQLVSGGKEIRSDQYIFVFLKFIQGVIPTINYDHTTSIE